MLQRPRDSQQRKLYRAERCTKRRSQAFKDLRVIRGYTNRIIKHKWFQERWPDIVCIGVRKIRSDANAHGWYSGGGLVNIQIPKTMWAMKEAVVLHEIAHGITEYEFGVNKTAWHGREFAKIFASLVQHYMGTEAGRELRASYKKHRVKWRSNGRART